MILKGELPFNDVPLCLFDEMFICARDGVDSWLWVYPVLVELLFLLASKRVGSLERKKNTSSSHREILVD